MNKSDTLDLDFPDWSDHPPPPRLSNEEYVAWVESHQSWLPGLADKFAADPSAPGPVDVFFQM